VIARWTSTTSSLRGFFRAGSWVSLLVIFLLSGYASGADRVALVIGNSAYGEGRELKNPANDASAVVEALRRLDFDVPDVVLDADWEKMRDAIDHFKNQARGAKYAIFYYAGHAMQVTEQGQQAKNYLIPVGAEIKDLLTLQRNTIEARHFLRAMEDNAQISIMILDACRDNPFENELARSMGLTRSYNVSRGLARIPLAPPEDKGTIIAYAAQPGATAKDGDGEHSPFTKALLEEIEKPNQDLHAMFANVAYKVNRRANQFPDIDPKGVPVNEHYLKRDITASEGIYWNAISNSDLVSDFETFLVKFPKGTFAELARKRLTDLRELQPREDEEKLGLIKEETIHVARVLQETGFLKKLPSPMELGGMREAIGNYQASLGLEQTGYLTRGVWEKIRETPTPLPKRLLPGFHRAAAHRDWHVYQTPGPEGQCLLITNAKQFDGWHNRKEHPSLYFRFDKNGDFVDHSIDDAGIYREDGAFAEIHYEDGTVNQFELQSTGGGLHRFGNAEGILQIDNVFLFELSKGTTVSVTGLSKYSGNPLTLQYSLSDFKAAVDSAAERCGNPVLANQLLKIEREDKQRRDIQTALAEAKRLEATGNLKDAQERINRAMVEYADIPELKEKQRSIALAIEQQHIVQIAEAERAVSELLRNNQYDAALAALSEIPDLVGRSETLLAYRQTAIAEIDNQERAQERAQRLASLLAQALMASDQDDYKTARAALVQGLSLEPNNQDFLALQERIDRLEALAAQRHRIDELIAEGYNLVAKHEWNAAEGVIAELRKADSSDPRLAALSEHLNLQRKAVIQAHRSSRIAEFEAEVHSAINDGRIAAAKETLAQAKNFAPEAENWKALEQLFYTRTSESLTKVESALAENDLDEVEATLAASTESMLDILAFQGLKDRLDELTQRYESALAAKVEADQRQPMDPATRIVDLLAKAKVQMSKLVFTVPLHDNAFKTFNEVLDIDQNNKEAKKGLVAIAEQYKEWAEQRRNAKLYSKSIGYIDKSLSVLPPDAVVLKESLTKMRADVIEERKTYNAAAALAKIRERADAAKVKPTDPTISEIQPKQEDTHPTPVQAQLDIRQQNVSPTAEPDAKPTPPVAEQRKSREKPRFVPTF